MPVLQKANHKSLDEVGGRERPLGSFYHVAIHHWDETMQKKDEIVIDYQILAGTTPGQEGKIQREYVSMKKFNGDDNTENFGNTIRRILFSAGVIGPNDAVDRDVTEEVKGRQLVIEIEEREYDEKKDGVATGKKKKASGVGNFGNAVFPIGDPAVAHVPLNQNALRLLGPQAAAAASTAAAGAANGSARTAAPTPAPVGNAAPAAAAGGWANV